MCSHTPTCPSATSPDHSAAHVVTAHPEQGWSRLCNGVVLFEDYGELLPDGRACVAAPLPARFKGRRDDATRRPEVSRAGHTPPSSGQHGHWGKTSSPEAVLSHVHSLSPLRIDERAVTTGTVQIHLPSEVRR